MGRVCVIARRGRVRDRNSIRRLALLLCAFAYSYAVSAASPTYPAKSVRMIVPFPPGGGTDIVARMVSRAMGDVLGQSVVVDNRAGAGGIAGTELAAKAPADGYTVVTVIITHATNPSLYPSLPFDSVADFTYVGMLTKNPQLFAVNATLPVKSLAEFIALARAKNGELIFASGGNGTPSHLASELLNLTANIKMVHVPYKGSAPAALDLVAGRVSASFSSLPALYNFVKAGKLRALATAGLTRSLLLPEVPTVAESGFPGFEVSAWQGLLAPAGVPKPVVLAINRAARQAIENPDVKARLISQGYEPAVNTPDEFRTFVIAEMTKWGRVIRDTGMKAD